MSSSSPLKSVAFAVLTVGAAAFAVWLLTVRTSLVTVTQFAVPAAVAPAAPVADGFSARDAAAASAEARDALAAKLRDYLNREGVRTDEGLLTFKDAAAYQAFLARARAAGVEILARIDGLFAVRVRVADYGTFIGELGGHANDYAAVAANPILSAEPPPPEARAARYAVPVGADLLSVLGVRQDNSAWGSGVTVAVLDGGASPDATLGTRLKYLDIGYGVSGPGSETAHATSVAALVAGASADARGLAPSASVLSIRVTGTDGLSDTFSVAQGIYAALDAGAQVINISLGGYATSTILGSAVEEALAQGVALVASSGNDQAARLVYPAAYSGVVSVGAVDAAGLQALFSNSGSGLQLTAPGYAIQTAGAAGSRVSFTGTSASAPVVAGAIAAVLSTSPGLTALEAADTLATYANDGGALGDDPDYGRGSLNMGWTMDRANPARVDPAISSQTYNRDTGTVSVVVQNRGAQTLSGLTLTTLIEGGTTLTQPLDPLDPATSVAITIPIDRSQFDAEGQLIVRSALATPAGILDQDTTNNRRTGLISAP